MRFGAQNLSFTNKRRGGNTAGVTVLFKETNTNSKFFKRRIVAVCVPPAEQVSVAGPAPLCARFVNHVRTGCTSAARRRGLVSLASLLGSVSGE